jgi:ribosomal-protein-alanine N-acetyltransferase
MTLRRSRRPGLIAHLSATPRIAVVQNSGRVLLRAARPADREEFIQLMRGSRRHLRPWIYVPETPDAFDELIRRGRTDEYEFLLVCLKDGGAIVGSFHLSQIFRGGFQSAYLGFAAGGPYAGRGFMRKGLELTLRHAFRTLRLHRVEANVQPGNERSKELVKRCGFRLEGFSPRYLKVGGRWRDHERYALTIEDWKAAR